MTQLNEQTQNAQHKMLNQDMVLNGIMNTIESFAYGHNYAYIVTVILSQIGMNKSENNIEDTGALQKEISKGQTQFSTMQQFMSLLESNTSWNGSSKTAYWPPSFEKNNEAQMNNFVNAFGQFFWNSGSSNDDTSTTTTDFNINYTLSAPFSSGHVTYPAGTKIIINPCAGSVSVQTPGSASPTVIPFGGPFATVLTNVRSYIDKVSEFVTGSSYNFPAPGSTVPQYLAAAMANLQTNIDSSPEGFQKDCFTQSATTNPIQTFAGDIDTNPVLTSAESLYSNFAGANGVDGAAMTSTIQSVYEGKSNTSTLWNDMAGMMADWMQNKMSGQSSTGGTVPPGATYIYPWGTNDSVNTNSSEFLTATADLQDAYNEVNAYNLAGNQAKAQQQILQAIQKVQDQLAKRPLTVQEMQSAIGDINSAMGDITSYQKTWGSKNFAEAQKQLGWSKGHLEAAAQAPISEPGLFDTVQSSISMGASTYQSQTQQNAAEIQQESSTLTSYDQIGQSIITAVNKSEQTIAGNLKSS